MRKITFSKAECQKFLFERKYKLNIEVPKTIYFTKKKFLKNPNLIYSNLRNNFKKNKVAIRSSSKKEDNFLTSSAGKYKSF